MNYEQLLVNEIGRRDKRIAELENERDNLLAFYHDAMRQYDKHDNLRQQAKGIEDALGYFTDNDAPTRHYISVLEALIYDLRKQADELERE